MVPLYLARIEDLGPGDFVKVDRAGCSRRLHYGAINHSCRGSASARGTGFRPRAISVKRLKFYELAILFRHTVRNDR